MVLLDKNKRQDYLLCCLKETYFKYKDTDILKVKGWRRDRANGGHEAAGAATFMSDTVDLRTRLFPGMKKNIL